MSKALYPESGSLPVPPGCSRDRLPINCFVLRWVLLILLSCCQYLPDHPPIDLSCCRNCRVMCSPSSASFDKQPLCPDHQQPSKLLSDRIIDSFCGRIAWLNSPDRLGVTSQPSLFFSSATLLSWNNYWTILHMNALSRHCNFHLWWLWWKWVIDQKHVVVALSSWRRPPKRINEVYLISHLISHHIISPLNLKLLDILYNNST